jgi:hypothetical protein
MSVWNRHLIRDYYTCNQRFFLLKKNSGTQRVTQNSARSYTNDRKKKVPERRSGFFVILRKILRNGVPARSVTKILLHIMIRYYEYEINFNFFAKRFVGSWLTLYEKSKSCLATCYAGAKGDRQSSYSFLAMALDGDERSASRPGRALAPGKDPPLRYQLYRRLGGPQSWSGHRGWSNNLLPLPGIEHRLFIL